MYPSNAEPSLDELLMDPVAQMMMRGDGLRPEQVRSCMSAIQERLRTLGTIEDRMAGLAAVAIPQSPDPAQACLCPR